MSRDNRRNRHNRFRSRHPQPNRDPRGHVYDSNGPDVRIRGTAQQIVEKYSTLAKDAASAGDINMAESYLQHADHYQRIVNSWGQQVALADEDLNEVEDDEHLDVPVSALGECLPSTAISGASAA